MKISALSFRLISFLFLTQAISRFNIDLKALESVARTIPCVSTFSLPSWTDEKLISCLIFQFRAAASILSATFTNYWIDFTIAVYRIATFYNFYWQSSKRAKRSRSIAGPPFVRFNAMLDRNGRSLVTALCHQVHGVKTALRRENLEVDRSIGVTSSQTHMHQERFALQI